jgi:hypothetical protein
MLSKFSVLLAILATSFAASASIKLKPVPTGADPALPDVTLQTIPCDQIMDRLADVKSKISSHEDGLNGFLGQINQAYKDWYAQLAPLEGTTQTIPVGTFDPLQAAATNTDDVVNASFDNTDRLTTEMVSIVTSAGACSITAKPTAVPQRK